MAQQYIWGLVAGLWHALARHDPEYRPTWHVSDKLTAAARLKDPEASEVKIRRTTIDGPGTGNTLCGLICQDLARVGVDPEARDPICPACKARASA